MRPTPAALLSVLALSLLVACGGGDDNDDGASATSTSSAPASEKKDSSDSPSATPTDSPGAASPGQVPRPAPGTCQPVAESSDGVYDLGELGEVTLRMDGSTLALDVRSGGGWSTSVDSRDDVAEVEFTRDDEEIDFEGELRGGQLVIQVCEGDGD